jgi:hypothetical protein
MLIAALRLVPCCLCLSAMGGLATAGEAVFEGLDPLQWASPSLTLGPRLGRGVWP